MSQKVPFGDITLTNARVKYLHWLGITTIPKLIEAINQKTITRQDERHKFTRILRRAGKITPAESRGMMMV